MSVNSRSTRGLKLRNSCDACNLAKVRCNKTRPTCARCVSRGFHCVYGVSMRSGKHPASWNSRRRQAQEPPRSTHTAYQPSTLADPFSLSSEKTAPYFDDSVPLVVDPLDLDHRWMNISQSAEDLNKLDGMRFFDEQTKPHDDCTRPYSEDPFHGLQPQVAETVTQNLPLHTVPTGQYTTSSMLTTSMASAANSPHFFSISQPQQMFSLLSSCLCHQKILQRLSEFSQGSSVALPFDVALNQNNKTMSLCHSVISAQTCSHHDATYILTFAALIAKVISVCGSVHPQRRQNHPSSESSIRSRSPTWNEGDGTYILNPERIETRSIRKSTDPNNPGATYSNAPSPFAVPLHTTVGGRSNTAPGQLTLGEYVTKHRNEESFEMNTFELELFKVKNLIQSFGQRYTSDRSQTPYEIKICEDMVCVLEKMLVNNLGLSEKQR